MGSKTKKSVLLLALLLLFAANTYPAGTEELLEGTWEADIDFPKEYLTAYKAMMPEDVVITGAEMTMVISLLPSERFFMHIDLSFNLLKKGEGVAYVQEFKVRQSSEGEWDYFWGDLDLDVEETDARAISPLAKKVFAQNPNFKKDLAAEPGETYTFEVVDTKWDRIILEDEDFGEITFDRVTD